MSEPWELSPEEIAAAVARAYDKERRLSAIERHLETSRYWAKVKKSLRPTLTSLVMSVSLEAVFMNYEG